LKDEILLINMASSSFQGAAPNSHRRLDPKDLLSVRRLGKGLSGFLYEATWEEKKHAKKVFPLGSAKRAIFEKEVCALPRLEHPNISNCFGYTVGKSSCSLLLEYIDDNLQTTIQRRIEAQRKKNSTSTLRSRVLDVDEIKRLLSSEIKERGSTGIDEGSSSTPNSWSAAVPFEMPEAVQIISQIATGMKYLHDNGVAHGDLKPKNVLLRLEPGEKKVKLADFGLVETKKRIKLVSKRTRHLEVLTWKAPERLEELLGPVSEDSDNPFTDSDTDSEDEETEDSDGFLKSRLAMADVYSFGLTCSYVLGGKLLFPELSLTQLREQRMRGFKPDLPSTCPEYLKFIIHSCLDSDPLSRPTFSTICTLKGLLPHLPQLMHLIKGATLNFI
jgi:serine/threonine protein kinase